MNTPPKTCFVIMPFSDIEGYEPGHFTRVYQHLIKPACKAAGVDPVRGDEVKSTNYIAIDILQRILHSSIVVCDLSGRNPNVLYELGIRQAFDLPVVLITDRRTERVFDIQGLRTLEYHESLRVDSVAHDSERLYQAIVATMGQGSGEVNSLIRLLGVEKATIGERTEVSPETSLLLESLRDISTRLSRIEEENKKRVITVGSSTQTNQLKKQAGERIRMPNGEVFRIGDMLYRKLDSEYADIGVLIGFDLDGLLVESEQGKQFFIPSDDNLFQSLTSIPF